MKRKDCSVADLVTVMDFEVYLVVSIPLLLGLIWSQNFPQVLQAWVVRLLHF